jgi:CPA2 family monovalent cation:H+ antiporter-2
LPLKDAFIVLFFLTVGMLFMPTAIWDHYILCASSLLIIVLFKPLSAFCIMRLFDQPLATGLTTAVGLAQIGEFSFILTEEASRLDILPDSGFDIIMASAWLAIALNPLLFKMLGRWKRLENT